MPPHCDSMDGPVVTAARRALEAGNVDLVLPFVPKVGESEVRAAFTKTFRAAKIGAEARDVAELYFFETVVRIHRAGEGAAFTGLKPAGLDVGPAVTAAEAALESGSPDALVKLLCDTVETQVRHRFTEVTERKVRAGKGVDEARDYVDRMLGFEVYSNRIFECVNSGIEHAH
ncbi:MAG: DUF6448 family protein [Alphaproteobacteria bacterium]|nr:DUF6448 family protein [Alphaproteobacteria bacterium]